MWNDNRRKTIVLNIFLSILILAILGGLGYFMLRVRQETRKHDEQLSELYVQQQQQQTETRQESISSIQEEYDKDMDTVLEYLPGIVCWGDSLTMGSSGNISYPSVLKIYLETYFCDIYDFRSTIENAEDFSRLDWDEYKVSVPVVNMGAGGEDSYTILGRAGACPFVLAKDITIPADTEPVEISLASDTGNPVAPLIGGNAGVNSVFIGEVEGTLSLVSGSGRNKDQYFFTRLEAGEETDAVKGTIVETAATYEYTDYIHVVCIGTYGSFKNAADLVEQVKTLLARQTGNSGRFIVLGPCAVKGNNFSARFMNSIDSAMMQAFGNRYINVRQYLIGDGLSDAGITATKADKKAISAGKIPVSFQVSESSLELNGKAYMLIGKLVYERMESLGYFDEVFEELSIRDTTKQILKEDPAYFERILKNRLS